jgi:hypothetical protein
MTSHVSRGLQSLIRAASRFLTSFLSVLGSLLSVLGSCGACTAVTVAFGSASPVVAQQGSLPELQRINRGRLCVTNGIVSGLADDRLAVDTPSSRAIIQADAENAADQIAEIQFRYLGPSQESRPLASGELRRQIGLKLRAQDSCNLIYAMWHIEPDTRVAVSIKQNSALHTHEQCGAHGYLNFKSQTGVAPIHPGETHTLRAELHGKDMTVTADGKIAWQGSLGRELALPFGPPGFRTDNARFAFDYFASAAPRSRALAQQTPPGRSQCVLSEDD